MARLSINSKARLVADVDAGNIDTIVAGYIRALRVDAEAAADIQATVIQRLRAYPEKINNTNSIGNTLLHLAVLSNCFLFAMGLLELDLTYAVFDDSVLLMHTQNIVERTPIDFVLQKNSREWNQLIAEYAIAYCRISLTNGAVNNFINTYISVSDIPGLTETLRNLVVKMFTDDPTLINGTDSAGNTLLHLTAEINLHLLVAAILHSDLRHIGSIADPVVNLKNSKNETALLIALKQGYTEYAQVLLKYHASFYLERDKEGVHLVSQYLYGDYVCPLLEMGQCINLAGLQDVLQNIRRDIRSYRSPVEAREYLDRVASRLVGLAGDGSQIDFKQWAGAYADVLSETTKLCTVDACFKAGENFGVSVNYLVIHVRVLLELAVKTNNPVAERELVVAINTARIDQETNLLNLLGLKEQEHRLAQITGLYARLKEQKFLCYPGGWPGQHDVSGHAIYVDFKQEAETSAAGGESKDDTDCEISVFNLGGGLEKEYNRDLGFRGKFLPATADIHDGGEMLNEYLDNLIWSNLHGVDGKSIDQALDFIYDKNIFGRPVRGSADYRVAEFEQGTGNCIVKNYLFSMKGRIGNVDYRALYLQMLDVIFQQMQSYCGKELPTAEAVVSSLNAHEAVFRGKLQVREIEALSAFAHPITVCAPDRRKPAEGGDEGRLLRQLGMFRVSGAVVYHRGLRLLTDQQEKEHGRAAAAYGRD